MGEYTAVVEVDIEADDFTAAFYDMSDALEEGLAHYDNIDASVKIIKIKDHSTRIV